ncbi:TPA: phosphopyruvate hydratase [Candidatus Dependentiae bacterium]|nr:MAG: Enolase [candidate division TM6 bacterium GW2011_GWE2_31_21]KKP53246.1 MAG: Enolase [candidate division TM6 bacterium GW2011_GWF2_33_332]HBS48055.1 phosphopyruvate hydratase [Candidatus Dependentiae bacterium]HBZ73342.1 phosphopyruvate hydratase [Candidatus Dependentiae bacterium]
MKIKKISGREILDSRGFPTVECSLNLEDGHSVIVSVPSGASTGKYEAVELRDGDQNWYFGKGVKKAINNLENKIAPLLVGKNPDFIKMDQEIINLDGTDNKSSLGANATLAASMAVVRAQAHCEKLELFELVAKYFGVKPSIPVCMFNVLNGGVHANNGINFQEFMIIPTGEKDFSKSLEKVVVVYQTLKKLLVKKGFNSNLGDEGGFAPVFAKGAKLPEELALDFIVEAIKSANLEGEIKIGLDVAASQFFDETNNFYDFYGNKFSGKDLIDFYENLLAKYPIISIEDGFAEDDWATWESATKKLGGKVQLVGDDLFVTNQKRIKYGVERHCANAVLIKPNQIGTVSETIETIKYCKSINYKTVISHRSGETIDTFIADLVFGCNGGQFKCGAPARGERVAKYNRLLQLAR